MEVHQFGSSGSSVPVIGQGTWQIASNDLVVRTLQRGIDLGMTHIDTAELYPGAEEVVGKAIRGRRDEVFVVSKVLPKNASRRGTIAACERTLKKLGTDYLDCFLLHWAEEPSQIREAMVALRELVWAGKIRAAGVSNLSVAELEIAVEALDDVALSCNQVVYNLFDRAIEDEVIPWCSANGVAVVGYSPFAGMSDASPAQRAVLARVGAVHGRTERQVTLRYLTRTSDLFAIPKASSLPHVEENADSTEFELTEADVAEIEAAFPR
ncbi:MAG: aldo/keto reductase [Myxococcales bacterium]|nr:aldo/keto reductase [Myxococcales bacterium]